LGKELSPGFGLRQRRKKGKTGLQGELREVGGVVRCGVEHWHNTARGMYGRLQGQVSQLVELGHAPGWARVRFGSRGAQVGLIGYLGLSRVKPLAYPD
jgi:hypothetical protein